jgi:hypothetical protein
MRVKTSVAIDDRVLRAIGKATTRTRSRSRLIEDAAREYLARHNRAAREARAFMRYGWDLHAPDEATRNNPYVSPLRAGAEAGLKGGSTPIRQNRRPHLGGK